MHRWGLDGLVHGALESLPSVGTKLRFLGRRFPFIWHERSPMSEISLEVRARRSLSPVKPLPAGHHELIGKNIEAWSALELTIDFLIWELLRLSPDVGRVVTSKLDARPKMEMLHSIAQLTIRDRNLIAFLAVVQKDIAELVADRNMIIHGLWGQHKELTFAASMRKKSPRGTIYARNFSDKNLRAMLKRTNELQSALLAVAVHFPPSIRKSRGPIHLASAILSPIRPKKSPKAQIRRPPTSQE